MINQLFIEAVNKGELEFVKNLVKQGADLNAKFNVLEYTALHSAVFECNLEMVKLLCKLGCNLDAVDIDGNSALHWACSGMHGYPGLDIVNFLLQEGVNPNIKNNQGNTALKLSTFEYKRNIQIPISLIKATLLNDLTQPKPKFIQEISCLSEAWDEYARKIQLLLSEINIAKFTLKRIKTSINDKNSLQGKAFKTVFQLFFKLPVESDTKIKNFTNVDCTSKLSVMT